MDYLFLIIGLATLIVGGELLVRGAVAIAVRAKISALVVGMTIVSFGTSAPELLVSIKSALSGHPDIAIGNVVGSNISNLALVLGVTGLIISVPISRTTIIIDGPVMMIASIGFWLFSMDGLLEHWEALVLFSSLVLFIIFRIRYSRGREEEQIIENTDEGGSTNIWRSILLISLGCIGLYFGAEWLVSAATSIAIGFGISEHVIGISIVAIGTSLPELVTSVVAAVRRQLDISIGNLIGSNIFNVLAVLGITGMVQEIPVNDHIISVDIYWMLGISAALLPFMLIRNKIGFWEGMSLLGAYLLYLWLLFM